jgi:hypothetical protein
MGEDSSEVKIARLEERIDSLSVSVEKLDDQIAALLSTISRVQGQVEFGQTPGNAPKCVLHEGRLQVVEADSLVYRAQIAALMQFNNRILGGSVVGYAVYGFLLWYLR